MAMTPKAGTSYSNNRIHSSRNLSSNGIRRQLPNAQYLNREVTVPKWKLGTILMLTLCLGISMRELMSVVLSQGQFTLLLQDYANFSLPTTISITNNGKASVISDEGTNRSILLIHVGKAGGSTLRRVARIACKRVPDPRNSRLPPIQRSCSGKNALDQTAVPRTGKLIQDVFHMWAYNATLFPLVTTYLVTIRNPIERVISSFR
jgi:Sulfotransferase family